MKEYIVKNTEMKICLCCKYADEFVMDEWTIGTDDVRIRCRFFPEGARQIGIGADCEHFISLFAEQKKQQSLFNSGKGQYDKGIF